MVIDLCEDRYYFTSEIHSLKYSDLVLCIRFLFLVEAFYGQLII